jgi:folate-binding protein YgfZ
MDIYPESRGMFLPHRLNLHKSTLLSFDKGCYKGQEIIARTHYRATLKHTFQCYTVVYSEPLYIGMKLINTADNSECGELIDYSPLSANSYIVCLSHLITVPEDIAFEGSTTPLNLKTSESVAL